MFKRVFLAIAASVKSVFAAVGDGLRAVFGFLASLIVAFCTKIILPAAKFVGKYIFYVPIRFVGKYIIYIPLKYIVWAVSRLFYYIVYVPLKYLAIKIYKYILKPVGIAIKHVCKAVGFACVVIYNYVVFPVLRFISLCIKKACKAIYIAARFLVLKTAFIIKTVFVHIGKFVYRFILYPLCIALKFICKCIKAFFVCIGKFIYCYIMRPIYWFFEQLLKGLWFITVKIFKFIYKYIIYPVCFAIYKLLCLIKFIVVKVAKFIYKFIIYPICFAIYKLLCFIKFITIKVGKFIYYYIIYPIYWFIKTVFTSIFKALKAILEWVWRAVKFIAVKSALFFAKFIKFLYQALLVVIFLPIIALYYFVFTLITSPYYIFKTEIPFLKNSGDISTKKVFLHPWFILKNRRQGGLEVIEAAKMQKADSLGLIRVKHYCGLITMFIWLVLLYPINLLILLF